MNIVTQYLGNFGRYQFLLYFFVSSVPCIHTGMILLGFTWSGFPTSVRCRLPEEVGQVNVSMTIDDEFLHRYFAKPVVAGQYCSYCPTIVRNSSCSTEFAQHCQDGFVYDDSLFPNSLTVVLEMSCERSWMRAMIWSFTTLGLALGGAVFGPLADKFGRRPVFLLCVSCNAFICFAAVFAKNFVVYALLIIAMGAFGYGAFLSSYIVFMELVDGFARTACGVFYQGFFASGLIYIGIIAYFIRDWWKIQLFLALPSLLYIPYFWVFPESIRWLLAQGRVDEAKKYFKRAARVNDVEIPDDLFEKLNEVTEPETKQGTVADLCKHKRLAKNTIIVFFSWMAASMGYYGLSQNTHALPGDVFVNYMLSALSEFPGFIICVLLMEFWGRKPALVLSFTISGVFCVTAGFVTNSTIKVTMAVLGKMLIAGAFAVIYNYSAEIFPTVVRQAGTGASSVCARIGSFSAPQVYQLSRIYPWVPIVLYGSVAFVCGILDLFLPETKGREIPETIVDGANYERIPERSTGILLTNSSHQQKDDEEAF